MGVLITDDRGWTFAPTALYVANEVHSDETPNAIVLTADAVKSIVAAMLGSPDANAEGRAAPVGHENAAATAEIGVSLVTDDAVERAERSLSVAPPVPFDIARQVRVFEPYIQYVEISLRGCAIQRYRLEVPRSIQGLGRKEELSSRLRTTFELIERNSQVSSTRLEEELNRIRDNFTRSLAEGGAVRSRGQLTVGATRAFVITWSGRSDENAATDFRRRCAAAFCMRRR